MRAIAHHRQSTHRITDPIIPGKSKRHSDAHLWHQVVNRRRLVHDALQDAVCFAILAPPPVQFGQVEIDNARVPSSPANTWRRADRRAR